LAHAFELPPEITQVPGNAVNAGTLLQNYYKHILGAFEEIWMRNLARHRAQGTVPNIASHNTGIQHQQPSQPPQPIGVVPQQSLEKPVSTMSGAHLIQPGAPGNQQMIPQNQSEGQRPDDLNRARSETHVSTMEQETDEQCLKRKREESSAAESKRARTSAGMYFDHD